MIIKELTLFTPSLEAGKAFYRETLGFSLLEDRQDFFSIKIGLSKLTFQKSQEANCYHYCFLIPSNQLQQSIEWLESRLTIIKLEGERIIERSESWNADSVYFYDGSGNIAEFIVRYDLKNEEHGDFNTSSIISVNEIGVPTNDVTALNTQLENELNTQFWKGNKIRFGTNGDQDGLFLLPNYEIKDTWFATSLKLEPAPFKAIVSNQGIDYQVEYRDEKLTTRRSVT